MLAALDPAAGGPEVYGVTTGMGALSDVRLTPQEQADHGRRLLLARAVGGPPWLEEGEVRALVAVRLRTFLDLDAGVSAGLCSWLADLLDTPPWPLPEVPRTGSGAAGRSCRSRTPGAGSQSPTRPWCWAPRRASPCWPGCPPPPRSPSCAPATYGGWPGGRRPWRPARWVVAQVSRDSYDDAVARGDDVLGEVLGRVREWAGAPATPPRHLQAPVSFRVVGPVLAHLDRESTRLAETAERVLSTVTDSPAYLVDDAAGAGAGRFVGTAGFHGLDLAAGMDALRAAVVHAAAVSAARLHRLLDPGVTGLPAQLSADPARRPA